MKLVITKHGIEGYTAGWIAKRMLEQDCEWIQVRDGDKIPPMDGQDVLMFGLSYSRQVLIDLANKTNPRRPASIHVFDNCFEVKAAIAGLKNVKINLNQTAARMAWEHLRADFRVKCGPHKKQDFHFLTAPWIVDYSDDAKKWKWRGVSQFYVKLAIAAYFTQELESWDELATRDLGGIESLGKDLAKKRDIEEPPAAALAAPETKQDQKTEEPEDHERNEQTRTGVPSAEGSDAGSKRAGVKTGGKSKVSSKNKSGR